MATHGSSPTTGFFAGQDVSVSRPSRLPRAAASCLLPAACCLLLAATIAIDCPLAAWCVAGNCPRGIRELLDIAEPFGNGLGVLFVLAAIHQLDRQRRWALPRLLATSFGAGAAADIVKLLVARTRPFHFDFHCGVADTFGQWFPFLAVGSVEQSFPSAHAATAAGLAIGLAWLYPRGRRFFALLAVLVAFQRIASGVHYPSDALCGIAVGYLAASACLKWPLLAQRFERWENHWRSQTRSARVS